MKYRKKPVEIEAIQWNGNNYEECKNFLKGNYDNSLNYPNIKTLNGVVSVSVGEYLCKGVNGEFYPCNPDIFHKTYEPVFDTDADIETCESCGKKFDTQKEKYGFDDDSNYFCEKCWKELEPVLKAEYEELKRKGEIE